MEPNTHNMMRQTELALSTTATTRMEAMQARDLSDQQLITRMEAMQVRDLSDQQLNILREARSSALEPSARARKSLVAHLS